MDDPTRRRLLELIYELLPEEEAAELRRRIDAEPELAAAYDEARAAAELFGEAARLPTEPIQLKRPESAMSTASEPPRLKPTRKLNGPVAPVWARVANWVVGLAAAILLLMSAGGYWYHLGQLRELAAQNMRLRVTGPATIQAGVDNTYRIDTTAITGQGMPAEIEFAVYSPDDKRLLWHKDTTGDDGRLEVAVPADMELPDRAVLKVAARRADPAAGEKEELVETSVSVERVRYATHLALDKPLYQPGETVYYRSLTLSRFGLAVEQEMPIHFEILDPSGAWATGPSPSPGSWPEVNTPWSCGASTTPFPRSGARSSCGATACRV